MRRDSTSSSSSSEDFKLTIRERDTDEEEYKRPELLKIATEEIEAEVAAKADASESESEYESDSDEEEDDEANQLTPAVDSQIFRTIAAIKAKDPSVYHQVDFFKDVKTTSDVPKTKAEPVVTLKDYEREMVLKHGGYVDEASELPQGITHREEQEQLRNAFKNLSETEDDSEDDGFLIKKEKTVKEKEAEASEYKHFLLEHMSQDEASQKAVKEWSEYKEDPKVSSEDAFLMDYVLNRGWIETEAGGKAATTEVDEVDKDEADLDDIDRFESKYNFRYEEEGGATIQTYARHVEGSARRTESKRAKKRAREKARKELLKKQKVEELKEQKNKKRKEIQNKLKEIYEISGSAALGLENIDLDADFDPAMFDQQMNGVFDDQYYDGEDSVKPTWEDDIDTSAYEQGDMDNMDADYLPGGDKFKGSKRKHAAESHPLAESSTKNQQVEQLMDEYYSLNYEDVVGGDVYTRFKYAKTAPEDYGLTAEEILLADDAELNKYVGIKQMAT
ncbi:KRI1-like family C-terminal-domain-containing protein [Sporodiniella umbellata]|nr:KRI1-like family C-terminal-domain-containing protein [Sporodiniella umbellata]